jgi:RNA polymerase-interacting CarD/CdnL/TRCF family regulator
MSVLDRSEPSFAVGERVVFPGHGLGTVVAIEAGEGAPSLVIGMDEGTRIRVPREHAGTTLRRLPLRDEALRYVERLLEPSAADPRGYDERSQTFLEAVTRGDLGEQIDLLRAMLARSELSLGERKQHDTLARNVIAVLAEVLGEDAQTLHERVVLAQRTHTPRP